MARTRAGRIANRGGRVEGRGGRAGGRGGRVEGRGGSEGSGRGGGNRAVTSGRFGGRHGGQVGRASGRSGSGRQQSNNGGKSSNHQQQQQQSNSKTVSANDNDNKNDNDNNNNNKNGGDDNPPSPWRNSKAKEKLEGLLRDETSWVQIMTPYQVWLNDPDFKKYKENNFVQNFKALKERIETKQQILEFDKANIKRDQLLHPASAMNKRGDKRYQGSEAEKQLKKDVKDGKSIGVVPKVLFASNPIYKESGLTLKQFRSHKYQEERAIIEKVYWQKKRNDKDRKKHDKEVARMQEESIN